MAARTGANRFSPESAKQSNPAAVMEGEAQSVALPGRRNDTQVKWCVRGAGVIEQYVGTDV